MTEQPIEARCGRCSKQRPVFPYKPDHDCVETAGLMSLTEAAHWIDQIRETGDRWCEARIDGFDLQPKLCVPCHDREHADETAYIKEHQL